MQEQLSIAKTQASPPRSAIPWQRQLPAQHATVRELKCRIAAFAYGRGESAKEALENALPWMSSDEKAELFAYHGVLRTKLSAEFMSDVVRLNPEIEFRPVFAKPMFTSSDKRIFGLFLAWLGRDLKDTFGKMQDGDVFEIGKRKQGSNRERVHFTFEKKNGVISVSRGKNTIEVSGEVSKGASTVFYTDSLHGEIQDALTRLSETAFLLDPRVGTDFRHWGHSMHRLSSAAREIQIKCFFAQEDAYSKVDLG